VILDRFSFDRIQHDFKGNLIDPGLCPLGERMGEGGPHYRICSPGVYFCSNRGIGAPFDAKLYYNNFVTQTSGVASLERRINVGIIFAK
jgi:hypothetical protein